MAPSPQQSTGTNTYVELVPLTLHSGAEIRGVDLSKPLSPEQVNEVRDAFLKWKVVFFRGQNLDHAQHVGRQCGGPLEQRSVGCRSGGLKHVLSRAGGLDLQLAGLNVVMSHQLGCSLGRLHRFSF